MSGRWWLYGAVFLLLGCGSEGNDMSAGMAADPSGISQAGAQDFGLFRQILEAGEIPSPETLDDVGFFAEHKLDYPAPDCGQNVCMHGLVGVMGNLITGSTCTLVQIGLNTPIEVESLERPPLNLVVVVDTSGSMAGEPMAYVREGLRRMLDHLQEEDRISVVTYATEAQVLVASEAATDRKDLEVAIASLQAAGGTNLYDGLFTGFQLVSSTATPTQQNRIILLSDGVANEGIVAPGKFRSLAAGYAREGIGITTIGVGQDFDVEIMRSIAETGAGNFYFLEDPKAMVEVFTSEVQTMLMPIAVDVRIEASVGTSYRLGDAYGTNGWVGTPAGGVVEIPSLFVARRTDASAPVDGGRRGGGGAILLELLPQLDLPPGELGASLGALAMSWTDPVSGETYQQDVDLHYPYASGAMPEEGYFSHATVQKAFVMLNLYVAFQMAAELAMDSDTGSAIGVLQTIGIAASDWLESHPDPDLEDDMLYVDLFIQNLEDQMAQTPVNTPPEPWAYD